LLDADSNSAKVRQYIWEGTVDLVSLHPPLKFPDGSQDRFNLLRPLIGYGPESMYVAFNPFYIPQLGQIEKRNASPDRAHNETWDAMVITGVLGLVVYLALFISVFYYGAKWLGLIVSQAQTRLFLGTCLVGMLLLSTGLAVWRGVEYIGLGIPLGIVGGVILYIGYSTLVNRYPASVKEGQEARVVTLIGLSVALFVHFIEINFGIAIASTRLYFWVYAALLVLVGYILPGLGVYGEAVSQPDEEKNEQSTEDKPVASGKARRMKRSEKALMPVGYSLPLWLRDVLPSATIVALILVTLGYDLVANLSQSSSLGAILVNSLTRLPNRNNAYSNGILALILTAWLASVFLVASENRRLRIVKDWLRMLLLMMAFSSIIGLVFWFWHIESLVTIAKPTVQSGLDAFDQVTRVNSLLPHYYFYVIGLLLLCGIFFQQWKPVRKSRTGLTSILVLLIVALVSFWGVYKTNVQVIQADMVFKMADQFNQPGRYQVARLLYKRSNSLAPDEDYYYLFLGRNYLEEAKTVSDPTQQAELVKAAEEDLKLAQRINPLNTDHTANLGRLYSWWAAISDDPLIRQQRGEIASNYYTMATTLSPNNSTLWGEWALLYLEIFQQPDEALTRLEHALSLDPRFNWTQGLMGDYYVRVGRSLTDTVKRREAFETALQHYRDALALSKSSENLAKIGYLLASANADIELGNLGEAITAYQDALALNPRETDVWRIEETLAHVYLQAGDKDSALYYGNLSLNAAPADQKSRLQDFLDQIMAGP
jgi:tetratricopeptide (TPR) repeat protein